MQRDRYLCLILIKIWICRQVATKLSTTTFYNNSSGSLRVLTCGKMDRHKHRQAEDITLWWDIPVVCYKYHKIKRNSRLNTTNGVLAKMESD